MYLKLITFAHIRQKQLIIYGKKKNMNVYFIPIPLTYFYCKYIIDYCKQKFLKLSNNFWRGKLQRNTKLF